MGVEEVVMSENESAFEITKRRGIIVWVYSLRQLKSLKRFGLVHYISKKSKYVCLYVNEEKVEEVIKKLEGVRCGGRPTSCPDQLCRALHEMGY